MLTKLNPVWDRAAPEGDGNQIPEAPKDDVDDEPGAWEEDFKSHRDSKPYGPEAVALDFTFPQAQVLFGTLYFRILLPKFLTFVKYYHSMNTNYFLFKTKVFRSTQTHLH